MVIVAGAVDGFQYVIKSVHGFLFHAKAGAKKQQQRFITAVQQIAYKAIGHCIGIGAGISSNGDRLLPFYFSNRGDCRRNAGRMGNALKRVAAVGIIDPAVALLPIVGNF